MVLKQRMGTIERIVRMERMEGMERIDRIDRICSVCPFYEQNRNGKQNNGI